MVNELHDVLHRAAQDAPAWRHGVDDFVAAGQRLRRRRTRRAVAAASAGLVVAAMAVLAEVRPPWRTDGVAPVGTVVVTPFPTVTKPSLNVDVTGYRVGRFRVGDATVASPDYQRAPVYADGVVQDMTDARGRTTRLPASQADLVVYRPGAYAPPSTGAATAPVGGLPAFRWTASGQVTLAWQYQTGAWATLTTAKGPAPDLLLALPQLAAHLTTGPQRPATVPFTLGHVPRGFAVAEVGLHAWVGEQLNVAGDDQVLSSLLLARTSPRAPGALRDGTSDGTGRGQLRVDVVPNPRATNPVTSGQRAALEPACQSVTFCYLWSADGNYLVEVVGTHDVPQTELLQVLAGLRLVAPGNPAAWPAAVDAVP